MNKFSGKVVDLDYGLNILKRGLNEEQLNEDQLKGDQLKRNLKNENIRKLKEEENKLIIY